MDLGAIDLAVEDGSFAVNPSLLDFAAKVKAAGGVRDLDGLIKVRDLGGSRCGATATATMMDDYRKREAAGTLDTSGGKIGAGGY